MIAGTLWHTGQLQCLNDLFAGWVNTHAFPLEDDIQPAARNDIKVGGCYVGVPRSHEARSFYFNETRWRACNVTLPPPYTPGTAWTYGWPQWRDQMKKLAQCGVIKPLVLQECMVAPWFGSLLQSESPPIPLLLRDSRTSAWRNNDQFNRAMLTIVWPVLRETMRVDPEQTMVREWIYAEGKTMRLYLETPLADWPADEPVWLDRSECVIATRIEGSSSHIQTSAPEIKLAKSPGVAGSLQSWVWGKSSRSMPPAMSILADKWLTFIAEYIRVDGQGQLERTELFGADFAAGRCQSVWHPDSDRTDQQGPYLDSPDEHRPNTHLTESAGIVTRFLADLAFKQGLTPESSDEEVLKAIAVAAERASVLLDLFALPDCRIPEDTVSETLNGTLRLLVFDADKANKTCLASYRMQRLLEMHPLRLRPLACLHPAHTVYALNSDRTSATADWDWAEQVNRTCQFVHNESLWSLESAHDRTVPVDVCPYITPGSGLPWAMTCFVAVHIVLAVLVVRHRKTAPICSSSWNWSLGLLASSAVLACSTAFAVGPQDQETCVAFGTSACVLATSLVACLFVKALRIHRIFRSKDIQVVRVPVGYWYAAIMGTSLVLAALRVSLLGDNMPATAIVRVPLALGGSSSTVLFATTVCTYSGPAAWYWGLQLTLLCALALVTVWLTAQSRGAKGQFLEGTTLLWMSVALCLMIPLTVAVLTLSGESAVVLHSVMPVILVFLLSTSGPVYTLPKLYHVGYKHLVRELAANVTKLSSDDAGAGRSSGQKQKLGSGNSKQTGARISPPPPAVAAATGKKSSQRSSGGHVSQEDDRRPTLRAQQGWVAHTDPQSARVQVVVQANNNDATDSIAAPVVGAAADSASVSPYLTPASALPVDGISQLSTTPSAPQRPASGEQ